MRRGHCAGRRRRHPPLIHYPRRKHQAAAGGHQPAGAPCRRACDGAHHRDAERLGLQRRKEPPQEGHRPHRNREDMWAGVSKNEAMLHDDQSTLLPPRERRRAPKYKHAEVRNPGVYIIPFSVGCHKLLPLHVTDSKARDSQSSASGLKKQNSAIFAELRIHPPPRGTQPKQA